MVFTELTKKAMKIAYKAHEGQYDAEGIPYIYHPARIGASFDTEAEVCVGLLHDVIEDSDVTLDYLKKEGFSEDVLEALALLTHSKGSDYMEYVIALASNSIAREVKMADLKDNIRREPEGDGRDEKRLNKHIIALKMLSELIGAKE